MEFGTKPITRGLAAALTALCLSAAPALADVLLITNAPDSRLLQVSNDGSTVTPLAGPVHGLADPTSMAYDAAGNLFIASQDNKTIYKRAPDGTMAVYASGLTTLRNMTVSPTGEVYITETLGGTSIHRVNPDGTLTTFAAGSGAGEIIFDASGTLIYTAGLKVYTHDLGTDTSTEFADLTAAAVAGGINGLAFDAAGNLYGSLNFTNKVVEIGFDGTVADFITANLDRPSGILFEDSGTVLVTNFVVSGDVNRYTADGTFIETLISGLRQPKSVITAQGGPVVTPEPPLPVPEPATLLILGAGLAAGLRFRRKPKD